MPVSQNDFLAKAAIQDALGVKIAQPFVGLVVVRDEQFCGAFIFNNYDCQNVDATAVIIEPFSLGDARNIARYVFETLGCKRVTCSTLSTNAKAINRLLALGFEREGVQKERFPAGDAVIFGLLRSKQKILRLTHEYSPSA